MHLVWNKAPPCHGQPNAIRQTMHSVCLSVALLLVCPMLQCCWQVCPQEAALPYGMGKEIALPFPKECLYLTYRWKRNLWVLAAAASMVSYCAMPDL